MKNDRRALFFIIGAVCTIALAIFVAYQKLPSTFFQQDEWQYFGINIYAQQSGRFLTLVLPQQGQLTHFFPLSNIQFYFEHQFFGLHYPSYIYLALTFHVINILLLFVLIKKFLGSNLVSFMTCVLFAVYSLASQPITWVAAGIGTLPSVSLSLISLIFFHEYLSTGRQSKLYITLLLALLSILFKEVSLYLFGFYVVLWFINRKSARISFRRLVLPIGIVTLLYLGIRIFFLFSSVRADQPEIGDVSAASPTVYLFRLFTLPLRAVTQSIIPNSWLLFLSDTLIRLAYPSFVGVDGAVNPYISQSIVFDLVGYTLSFAIFLAIFIAYKICTKNNKKELAKVLLWATCFMVLSSIPYIFIPGRAGYFSIFEPRNLYVISIGTCTLIAIFFTLPFVVSKNRFMHVISGAIFVAVIAFHITTIRFHIDTQVGVGSMRKRLLETVINQYPKLPTKVIFFTDSDSSYYGLPAEEKILPVQSGFGRMLLVWYQDSEHFPSCLYAQQFLHDLISEGYRECSGRGFGYVRSYEVLQKLLRENLLQPSMVISYSWNSQTKGFTDNSERIRTKLQKDTMTGNP